MRARQPTPTPATGGCVTARDALAADLERIAVGAVGLTTRALASAGSEFDVTFVQWRAIVVLGESEDGARVGEVAGRIGVTLPATSRLLHRLERRGLTVLAVDEQDRRATRARLTDRGRAVREAILAVRRSALREVAAALPASGGLDLPTGLHLIAARLDQFA